jgi:hypothetical protein
MSLAHVVYIFGSITFAGFITYMFAYNIYVNRRERSGKGTQPLIKQEGIPSGREEK